MKPNFGKFAICSLFSALFAQCANAATYYSGMNQAPQNRYSPTGASPMSQNQMANPWGNQFRTNQQQQWQRPGMQNQQQQQARGSTTQQQRPANNQSHKGFYASAGISHEFAMWQFEMKNAGSALHYDNIAWNVFDVNAGYGFDVGGFGLQAEVGVKIGMQSGESTMVDDDISKGGYATDYYYDPATDQILGYFVGRALSVGKSSGGSMFGYNIGLGLTDKLQFGNMRITPSVGWRSLSYSLKTNKNNGMAIEVLEYGDNCGIVQGSDETQCIPAIIFFDNSGNTHVVAQIEANKLFGVPPGAVYYDTGGTYFYDQPGTSHKYDVDWSGPYLAVDLDYKINDNNAVNGRIELGLPSYSAIGDQPYRWDWKHPKSVEDKAGIGSATHLGLGANWLTAVTNSVSLTLGFTYDYYSVSGADAKTFLSGDYWVGEYNRVLNLPGVDFANIDDPRVQYLLQIERLEEACPGWVCSEKGEIDSFYASIGIRMGISAKF